MAWNSDSSERGCIMSQDIEKEIQDLVAAEVMTSQALSNALFGPLGLFGRLAKTEQERRAIAQTPLFKRAQDRISELRRYEHAEYNEELERKCKARAARKAEAAAVPPANGPANGAATNQPAR